MQPKLTLASASPRRRELLSVLGLPFQIEASLIAEDELPGETPQETALRLAEAKAREVSGRRPADLILAADTVVAVPGENPGQLLMLGKPMNEDQAAKMLRLLSGRDHFVFTAFVLMQSADGLCRSRIVETVVRFRELSEEEIQAYISTGEPMDKAGAYGAQGIGACLIREVKGSYTNVVGLPLAEVTEELKSLGVWSPGNLNQR